MKAPHTGPEIFLKRLRKHLMHLPEGLFLCNPNIGMIREEKRGNWRILIGRLDGTSYYEFSGENVWNFIRQRHPRFSRVARFLSPFRFHIRCFSRAFNRFLDRGSLWLIENADGIIFQSDLSREMNRFFLGYRSGRIPETVIHNGVDTEMFFPRQGGRLKGNPAIVVSASVFRLHKRFQDAVRLVNAAASKYPDICLHVLGDFDPLVREIIPRLDMSRCVLHGMVPEDRLPEVYAGADVQLSLSIFDPCPNVVCEGLACGLPVITPVQSGAAELIGRENLEWSVKEEFVMDYMALQTHEKIPRIPLNAYLQALERIMDDLPRQKERARSRAETHLDIRKKAAEYAGFFWQISGNGPP